MVRNLQKESRNVVVVDRFHTFPMELGRRLFCCCVFQGKSRGIKFSSFPYAMHFRLVFISFMVVVMRRQEPPMSATTTRRCGSHALDTEAIHPLPFLSLGVLFRECVRDVGAKMMKRGGV